MNHSWNWCHNDEPVFVEGGNTDISLSQSLQVLQYGAEQRNSLLYRLPNVSETHELALSAKIKNDESREGRVWHHWVRVMVDCDLNTLLIKAPFFDGAPEETRRYLFYAHPLHKLACNVYFSLMNDKGEKVFDGSAMEFIGGLLCHTPQESERFFLDDKTFYDTLIARKDQSAFTNQQAPGARLEALWNVIKPHQYHLMSAFKNPPSTKNAHNDMAPLWQVGVVLPYMFYYSQCAKQALSDKGFLSWLSDPFGAKQYGGNKVIEHILLGDMSFQEKKHALTIVKQHVDGDTLRQWFFQTDHKACFKRGIMKSWMQAVSICGLEPKEVFQHMPDRKGWSYCLKEKAYDLASWLPYVEFFRQMGGEVEETIQQEMCGHYIIQAQRKINLQKNTPQELDKASIGWAKLQQAGLAPRTTSFEEAKDLLRNTRARFERGGGFEGDYEHPDTFFVREFQKFWLKEQLHDELFVSDNQTKRTIPRKRM